MKLKLLLSITGFSLLILESLLIILNLLLSPHDSIDVISYYYLIAPGILAYIFIMLAYSGFKGYGILVVSMILLIISDLLTISFFTPDRLSIGTVTSDLQRCLFLIFSLD